jgi:hypothetical protein
MPDDNSLEYPSVLGVLAQLAAAGPQGMLGSAMSRSFRQRSRGYNATQVEVNNVLHHLWRQGLVSRGGTEPTPYYHNVPAYRWYITSGGSRYFGGGGLSGQLRTIQAARALHQEVLATAAREHIGVLAKAAQRAASLPPGCVRERNRLICELRHEGLMLREIASITGLTRERVRQVATGIRVGSCHCGCED